MIPTAIPIVPPVLRPDEPVAAATAGEEVEVALAITLLAAVPVFEEAEVAFASPVEELESVVVAELGPVEVAEVAELVELDELDELDVLTTGRPSSSHVGEMHIHTTSAAAFTGTV